MTADVVPRRRCLVLSTVVSPLLLPIERNFDEASQGEREEKSNFRVISVPLLSSSLPFAPLSVVVVIDVRGIETSSSSSFLPLQLYRFSRKDEEEEVFL